MEFIDYQKFRSVAEGGKQFVYKYLQKFSALEDDADFKIRKSLAYCPGFAKSAVNDIKNSIFQRLVDVSRKHGPESYQSAIKGEGRGIDKQGSSMMSFLGNQILPELLNLSKVGVYIDRDPLPKNPTLADTKNHSPYIYHYRIEDIVGIRYDIDHNLKSVKLIDTIPTFDPVFGLPLSEETRYRFLEKTSKGIELSFYDMTDKQIGKTTILKLKEIPFVLGSIKYSLLQDAGDYQIALLNLSSSDLNYGLKSNFPFYTEQVDRASNNFKKANEGDERPTIKTGATQGRRYGKDLERPGFINPSSDPITASMKMRDQMKREIRELVNLAVENLGNEQGLEAGLSYIGLELERMERQIGKAYADYEGEDPPTIDYPNTYKIKTDDERYGEAEKLVKIRMTVPSDTYRKEVTKEIVDITMSDKLPAYIVKTIKEEIDGAVVIATDPEKLKDDVEIGIVSTETASLAAGYPKGEAAKAKKDRLEKVAEMVKAQLAAGNRGVDNNLKNPEARGIPTGDGGAKFEKEVIEETDG
jgi:hypothetical protein